jgi:hypothetical protein
MVMGGWGEAGSDADFEKGGGRIENKATPIALPGAPVVMMWLTTYAAILVIIMKLVIVR